MKTMTRIQDFPSTYFTSAAMEQTQPVDIQACLRSLWAVHHDDYAPKAFQTGEALPGGNEATVALIRRLRDLSVLEAQRELDQLKPI